MKKKNIYIMLKTKIHDYLKGIEIIIIIIEIFN